MTTDQRAGDVPASGLAHYAEEGPVYFYGGPFSNFAPSHLLLPAMWYAMHIGGQYDYPNVETYFQAQKAASFEDHERVRLAGMRGGPGMAKRTGRKITLRPDWDNPVLSPKYEIMVVGLRAKFGQSDTYREQLMRTGDRFIAEDSPTDYIWGIRDGEGGMTGRNLLGLALMQVRAEIQGGYGDSRFKHRPLCATFAADLQEKHGSSVDGHDFAAMLRAAAA